MIALLAVAAGLVLLVGGAELLVRGAAALAARAGVDPVIIGLTVVAFGTSAPELAVSLASAAGGDEEVALGNVVGSNIANILLILGVSALIGTLVVAQRIVRLDVPIVLGVTVAVVLMSLDGGIGRIDGFLLVAGVLTYTGWLVRDARRESAAVRAEYGTSMDELEGAAVDKPLAVQLGMTIGGLVVLVVGAQLLVGGAVSIAGSLGVSDLVIGLTVVAVGTSLPELATSVTAARRGERDLAVGNVIGSNLFNLLAVLGAAALAGGPLDVGRTAMRVDLPVMLVVTFVLVPVFWNGFTVTRLEGPCSCSATPPTLPTSPRRRRARPGDHRRAGRAGGGPGDDRAVLGGRRAGWRRDRAQRTGSGAASVRRPEPVGRGRTVRPAWARASTTPS
ncbi:MAG: calcium/sodium antiporter [Acidimicrobiales bacterium]